MLRMMIGVLSACLLSLAMAPAGFSQAKSPAGAPDETAAPAVQADDPVDTEQPQPAVAPEPVADESATPDLTGADAEAWLDGYMPYALARGNIAGAVVTIVKDGNILLSKGYGLANLETQAPVDPAHTLFRPGSISKLFTWTAVMQLVEKGKLDLDQDVNTYLDFKIPEAFGAPITLRHIMTHTPGFEEKAKNLIVEDPEAMLSLETYLKGGVPARIFPPGEVPAYSNYATALAGYIVARVSGLSFEEYVERNIFEPLGMSRSSFRQPLPDDFPGEMSKGYKKASEGEAQPFELIAAGPAGSLSSTGEDMGRFMIAHLQGGGELLSAETARQMHETADQHIPPLNGMRLGFYATNRNGQRIIAHGGDTQYFHSDLHLYLDQGVGLFLSMNSSGNPGATSRVRNALFEAFTDRYFPKPVTRTSVADTAKAHAAEVSGVYEISRGFRTNFFALSGFLGPFKVVADENGDLVTPAFKGVNEQSRRWREVEPYVWRDVDGKDRLAVRMENGKVSMLSFEPLSPIIVFQRPPWWRNAAILNPMLVGALGVLALTVIAWPFIAVVRWRYGASFPLEGRRATAYRLIRIAALFLLIWFAAWGVLMYQMLTDLALLDGSADGMLRALQFAAVIPLAALIIGFWNTGVVWTHKSSWFGKLWSVLLVIAAATLVWVGATANLFNFSLSY